MTNSDNGIKSNEAAQVRAYVAGAAAPAADRPVPELRAAIAGIVDALEAKVATANAEAQGWLEAALLARGKAEEARQEAQRLAGDLAYIRTERDALRSEADALQGKLGAAEADRDAWRHRALIAEAALGTQVREVDPWRAEIEARLAKLETMGTGMGTDPTARAREPKQGRSE